MRKIDELYQEYLNKKLDEIFNSQGAVVQPNLLKLEYSKKINDIFEGYTSSCGTYMSSIYVKNGGCFIGPFHGTFRLRDDGIYCRSTPLFGEGEKTFYPVEIYRNFAIVYREDYDNLNGFQRVLWHIVERNLDLKDYKVKKGKFNYKCSRDNDKFKVKYKPIKVFGLRYVMCRRGRQIHLYDRNNKTYKYIGTTETIEYDDNFIFDKKNNKVYLMYANQMIDITYYYNKYLINKDKIHIKEGIELLAREDFFYHSEEEIIKKLKEEKERKRQEQENKRIQEIEEQKKKLQKEKEEHIKKQQEEKEKVQKEKIEALKQIQASLEKLKQLKIKEMPTIREKIENIFIINGDHKEIDSDYIGILMLIDLMLVNFTNVKVAGIDFRGTNIEIGGYNLDPQKVYNKDLSNCNFEGIFIKPFADFRGVDIRGSRFSIDNNPMTLDFFNVTFKDAIWDENTTYNGRSFSEIFEDIKKNNK